MSTIFICLLYKDNTFFLIFIIMRIIISENQLARIIISENQLALIRRLGEIERLIDPTMDLVYEFLQAGNPTPLRMRDYDAFTSSVAMKLANEIVSKTRLDGDKKVTLRNQIQRTILNNYYSNMREYFMSRLKN